MNVIALQVDTRPSMNLANSMRESLPSKICLLAPLTTILGMRYARAIPKAEATPSRRTAVDREEAIPVSGADRSVCRHLCNIALVHSTLCSTSGVRDQMPMCRTV